MELSMTLSMSPRLEQRQDMELSANIFLGDYSGDIALLSLHKIKNRIPSLDIDKGVRSKLVKQLLKENREYRNEIGKSWNCITPIRLDNAVHSTREYLENTVETALSTYEPRNIVPRLREIMTGKVKEQDDKIKRWFVDHYDEILYDMDGKIPYAMVQRMREQLSTWSLGHENPFYTPIEDFVVETAKAKGLFYHPSMSTQDVFDALKELGEK
ncbi:hypothetical protein COU57_01330 [Candidatus Pacearchaeota archaeon CG10_big_fil_rev_8_21_14_0_10_32_14]|nr:MAG: hypothetical protein COU57_01330 [Candidatus Pacearchaeota archaeon CG10_big_fil_rev_8_21_14_0_10_32_14]